mmetsp:Transcript_35095/g.111793  ORF Transcript_35095/g.111793 Transcript_35095/m.111793 type:complete len:419 (+) Transcript_35095:3-1259(+)
MEPMLSSADPSIVRVRAGKSAENGGPPDASILESNTGCAKVMATMGLPPRACCAILKSVVLHLHRHITCVAANLICDLFVATKWRSTSSELPECIEWARPQRCQGSLCNCKLGSLRIHPGRGLGDSLNASLHSIFGCPLSLLGLRQLRIRKSFGHLRLRPRTSLRGNARFEGAARRLGFGKPLVQRPRVRLQPPGKLLQHDDVEGTQRPGGFGERPRDCADQRVVNATSPSQGRHFCGRSSPSRCLPAGPIGALRCRALGRRLRCRLRGRRRPLPRLARAPPGGLALRHEPGELAVLRQGLDHRLLQRGLRRNLLLSSPLLLLPKLQTLLGGPPPLHRAARAVQRCSAACDILGVRLHLGQGSITGGASLSVVGGSFREDSLCRVGSVLGPRFETIQELAHHVHNLLQIGMPVAPRHA